MKPGPVRTAVEATSVLSTRLSARRHGRGALAIEARNSFVAARLNIRGRGNRLIVDPGTRLIGVRLTIWGDDNTIRIGAGVRMFRGSVWVEGDGCGVTVGAGSTFERGVKLAAVECGCNITVGSDCMFSEDVELRTSDSHSIFDGDGQRINQAADITLGDRVWVGNGAMVLKGVSLADDTIVGARAVVVRSSNEVGIVLAGVPARGVRSGVKWAR